MKFKAFRSCGASPDSPVIHEIDGRASRDALYETGPREEQGVLVPSEWGP